MDPTNNFRSRPNAAGSGSRLHRHVDCLADAWALLTRAHLSSTRAGSIPARRGSAGGRTTACGTHTGPIYNYAPLLFRPTITTTIYLAGEGLRRAVGGAEGRVSAGMGEVEVGAAVLPLSRVEVAAGVRILVARISCAHVLLLWPAALRYGAVSLARSCARRLRVPAELPVVTGNEGDLGAQQRPQDANRAEAPHAPGPLSRPPSPTSFGCVLR
ncbi:hypothetical protein HU200_027075 [Digitaria exilis]|uniref:Uncharacterized protein n=1 Tax=Digitaria exilis TaxID=1010633 RepID=A0A835BY74_9POAL|nr:hypothetical protein HU200_027075 [Digitaria exilis]